MPIRAVVEHMIAVTYGITYDTVVTRFRPYETMLDEIVALVTRSAPVTGSPGAGDPDVSGGASIAGARRRRPRPPLARADGGLREVPRLRAALHERDRTPRGPRPGGLRRTRGAPDLPGGAQPSGLGPGPRMTPVDRRPGFPIRAPEINVD